MLAPALFVLLLLAACGCLLLMLAQVRQAAAMKGEQVLVKLTKEDLGADPPKVSVVIPARDEERNIGACLETVLSWDYPDFEVLVVDDSSSDRTPEIVAEFAQRDARIRPIELAQLSELEDRAEFRAGKSYVLHHAAREAQGEWLLFIDADTRQRKDGLWRAMAFARKHELQAFSSSGVYPNPTLWGDLLESSILIATFLAVPLRQTNDPAARGLGWANGQFVLLRKDAYEGIGGHAALKPFAFDDMSMARLIKANGLAYRFLPGGALFDCINYVGLDEAHVGWSRLVACGTPYLGVGRGFFFMTMLACLLLGVAPFLIAPLVLSGLAGDYALGVGGVGVSLRALAIGVPCWVILIQALNRAAMKVPVWRALLVPIAALLVLRSVWAGYRIRYGGGSVVWRGRTIVPDDPSLVAGIVAAHGGPLADR
ncbi:MAG TPA: hypothetical protein DEA08_04800 [Planctomycetes bacterium]|nr:hypothetical protein [Planctomycetota bacterium]